MNQKIRIFLILSSLLIIRAQAEEEVRHPYIYNDTYEGPHQAAFQRIRYVIPNLMRQSCINVAVRTGMDFEEGWRYPIQVGFVDGSPMGMENILAYVQLGKTSDGRFAQLLNINVEAYDKDSFSLEKVFTHELVHAMLNDAIGGEAARYLPTWFHEGLAVFGAQQGDAMVKTYAHRYYGQGSMINGLEGPHGAVDYAEDYLAMKYIYEKIGSNAFHNFIKNVIEKKGNIPSALEYTCFIKWDDFQVKLREYSNDYIRSLGPPERGENQKPY